MPEPRAFLAIERTMAAAMRAVWAKRATVLAATLQPLVDEGKWGDAQTAINGLTLQGVVGDVRPRIEELAVSAVLFGAHHASGSVKATTFMNGNALPKEIGLAIDQLVDMVEANGRDQLCDQLHVAIEALKQADDRSHMQKADALTTPDKRPDAQLAEDYPPDEDETGAVARAKERLYGLGHDIPGLQKNDISDAQLEETGGLMEPEQGQATPKKKRKAIQKTDKTLYVHRDLLNVQDFLKWAKGQGFTTTVPVEDLHVTLCYSKTPVDWAAMREAPPEVTVMEGKRDIEQFGKAVVLTFASADLADHNAQLISQGATSDFPVYRSHMTITYDPPERVIDTMVPYAGPLIFGPEVFEEVKVGGFDPDSLTEEVLKWERLFKAADMSLADKLNAAVKTGGQVPIDLGASLTTSRLVSLGFLAECKERGVQTYVVNEVLDDRTCPVCQYMHGKTFNTESQFDRLVRALSSQNADDAKQISPWPDQSKDGLQDLYGQSFDELQANGLGGPPYHPYCRGMLMLEGAAEEDIPLGGPDQAAQESETPEPETEAQEPQAPSGIDSDKPQELPEDWPVTQINALTESISAMNDQEAQDTALHALERGDYEGALSAAENADEAKLEQALPEGEVRLKAWPPEKIDSLRWERFDVTDPEVFADVDEAFEAGKYAEAQKLIDAWKASQAGPVAKSDQPSALEPQPAPDDQSTDDVDSSLNAARKKRKLQGAAGREQDYDDIQSDSSSIAFDNCGVGDCGAPIDRN